MHDLPKIGAAELIHDFEAVAARATAAPVMITREGCDPFVLLSAEEYDRLRRRERRVWAVEDLPEAWLDAIARSRD